MSDALFFSFPLLSLAVVLVSLAWMVPADPFRWLWRTPSLVAAVPAALAGAGVFVLNGEISELVRWAFVVSLFVSSPVAAILSVALAVRLRGRG